MVRRKRETEGRNLYLVEREMVYFWTHADDVCYVCTANHKDTSTEM